MNTCGIHQRDYSRSRGNRSAPWHWLLVFKLTPDST